MDQDNQNLFELNLNPENINHLSQAAGWAKFLSIVGFVFCGLFAIFAVFAGSLFSTAFKSMGGMPGIASGFFSFFYIIFAVLYFFPCLYLFYFASKMQVALAAKDQVSLNNSFRNLKRCFRYLGILTMVILGFYALALVGGIIAAATYGM